MRVAVTGANGQLGRAFWEVLPEATYLDRRSLDLEAPTDVIQNTIAELQPDILINCAAHTNVDLAETEPYKARKINSLAVKDMSDVCYKIGAMLVQVSTDYVFNSDPGLAGHDEDEEPDPQSVYARTKREGEAAALVHTGNMVVRTSGVFGEGNNFVKLMVRLGRENGEATVVDDQTMRPTYAKDLAATILKLVDLEKPPHIAHVQNSGEPLTWADYTERIWEIAGIDAVVHRMSTAEYNAMTEDRRRAADNFVPVAARPFNSIFSLKALREGGVPIREWPAAVTEYIATLG